MPCLSLKHVLRENARAKQARLARRNVAKSLETTRFRLKFSVTTSKIGAKAKRLFAKLSAPVNPKPISPKKTQKLVKRSQSFPEAPVAAAKNLQKPAKIAARRPHPSKITEETLKITHPRLSRVPQDGRKNVTAIYTTSAKNALLRLLNARRR